MIWIDGLDKKQLENLLANRRVINWLSGDSCRVREGDRNSGEGNESIVLYTLPDYSTIISQDWINSQGDFGYLPNSIYKYNLVRDRYGDQMISLIRPMRHLSSFSDRLKSGF